jgi:hypothetical protein
LVRPKSTTKNIFVVTSEWDTQIGKQLRATDNWDTDLFSSRIFSTEIGMRPAEPCSISVVATHQLLTNLFEYICVVILSDRRFRRATAAAISEQDLLVLERCNADNIGALSELVGANRFGTVLDVKSQTEKELRAAGDLWADHILENAKAYIMTFAYIFVTVISGYPIIHAIAFAAGFDQSSDWAYLSELALLQIPRIASKMRVLTVLPCLGQSPHGRCSYLLLASSNQHHNIAFVAAEKSAASDGWPNRRHW